MLPEPEPGAAPSAVVTLRSHTVEGVRLTEKRHAAGDRLPRHSHETPFVTFVLRGGYDESRGGSSVACLEGCALLHEAGETHEDRFGPRESHLLNLEWTGCGDGVPALRPLLAEGSAPRRIAATLLEELRRPDSASRLVVQSLVAEVVMPGIALSPCESRGSPGFAGSKTGFETSTVRLPGSTSWHVRPASTAHTWRAAFVPITAARSESWSASSGSDGHGNDSAGAPRSPRWRPRRDSRTRVT